MATRKQPKGSKRGSARKHSSYKVFISHSSRDKWIAERMAEKIEAAGADYWLDTRDLPGGGDIRAEIFKGVSGCQEVVILFSPYSIDSEWVNFEMGVAYKRRYLTPILNNVQYNEATLIQGIKAVELNDFDQYLSELTKRVTKASEKKKELLKKKSVRKKGW